MPLAYRDSLSGGDSTFTVTNVNVAAPTVAIGDLEIVWAAAAVLAPGTAPTIATPAGWTSGGTGASVPSAGGQVNTRKHLFWRISPNTGAVVNLNAGTTAVFVYDRLSYSGGPATTALKQVVFGSTGAATSAVMSSLTANGGTMLSASISLGAAQSLTAPAGMTARQNNATYGISAVDEQVVAAGATGTRTWTWASSSESVWGFAEFRPAHTSTGALVGQGSTVAGSAARTRAHPSSGALVGQGSTVVGSARHNVPHDSSGALTGQGSSVVGAANRTRDHASSGVLTGQGSEIVGSAARTRAHPSSGVLVGQGSEVVGVAARTRAHGSSGALVGPGSEIVGSADHQGAAGTHDATGALVGQGSAVSGSAARFRAFSASGVLIGQGSVVSGSAARVAPAVSHDATGVLVGQGSTVVGLANRGDQPPDPGGRFNGGFVITDTAPKLWWKRKPKALDEEEAEQKVAQVVRVVERIALRQVKAEQPEPAKEQKREVREAIAPLVAEMPGFDWMTLYRTILIELGRRQQEQQAAELAQMEIARIQAMRRDEDDVLILLMSL